MKNWATIYFTQVVIISIGYGCIQGEQAKCDENIVGYIIDEDRFCALPDDYEIGCRDRDTYPGELGMYGCYKDLSSEMHVFTWHQYQELLDQGWTGCDSTYSEAFFSRDQALWFCSE